MPSKFLENIRISGILLKVVLFGWLLIISTIILFVLIGVPYQKKVLFDRMTNEANEVVSSVLNKNESALMAESYSDIVDYLLGLIEGSNSIEYIVATKSDGYSLIIKQNNWRIDSLSGYWLPSKNVGPKIIYSELLNAETFHYSHNFVFSGINWGWIHVGLSLQSYKEAVENINNRAIYLSIILTIAGFFIAFFFARRLTKPITDLNYAVKKISDGDFSVVSNVKSGDELESLSNSFNKMTAYLQDLRDKLELRVKERTAELAETNTALIKEVQERVNAENRLSSYNLRLEALQDIYRGIISAKSTQEIIFETLFNLRKKMIEFSRASVVLYDFTNSQIVVHSISFDANKFQEDTETYDISYIEPVSKFDGREYLYKKNITDDSNSPKIISEIKDINLKSYISYPLKFQDEYIGEINFGSTDSNAFDAETITIIKEIGSQLAIALAQSKLEEQLQLHAENMQNSLREKEVLLKEIHHRVKNNLQIISSLLYLQSKKIEDKDSLNIFIDSQNRVKSMALVHEKLYKSENLSSIDFSEYVKNLTSFIANTYKSTNHNLNVSYNLEEIFIPIDKAAPLGLMINELLSNCFKYAFPTDYTPRNNEPKIVSINLSVLNGDACKLEISDNGIGLPKDFDIDAGKTLGMQLIRSLAQQLDSELHIDTSTGTKYSIKFNY